MKAINIMVISTFRTGLIYDPVMLDYKCEWDEQYPEKPDRIKKPYERCQFYGLTEKCIRIPVNFLVVEPLEVFIILISLTKGSIKH